MSSREVMMGKLKVIVKRPEDEYGHMIMIENTLETFQKLVNGHIEVFSYKNVLVVCNEEGKLRGLEMNLILGRELLVGNLVICGWNGEEFTDIPIDMRAWKNIVDMSSTKLWKEIE